ncbi:MAG: iron ABC transporter permease [Tepidisphaeraceae bacterium]|jgi:iron complex transport system permease protein
MKRWSAQRLILTLLVCAATVAGAMVLCVALGSTGVGWPTLGIREFRQESALNAALIGAALAAAGVAYQAVLRNPLADPYLLGVSSGASLMAYAWQLPVFASIVRALGILAPLSQQSVSFVGALAAVGIVLGIAGRRGRLEPVTLLLVGVIVNAVNGSLFLLINALVEQLPGNGGPMGFLVGGIQMITRGQRWAAFSLIAIGWIVLLQISGQLNVAGLDDGQAESLGVRVHRLRWLALIAASLMTAGAVAISGPIGFVGLLCPHVGRLLVGTDQRRLLPVATAIGAILLMAADALSRYLSGENLLANLLPVGVLTGLLGGPFFLWLLFRAKAKG